MFACVVLGADGSNHNPDQTTTPTLNKFFYMKKPNNSNSVLNAKTRRIPQPISICFLIAVTFIISLIYLS